MNGKGHLVVGLLAGAVVAYSWQADLLPAMTASAIGSLWPDTDHRKSLLGRFIPLWAFRGIYHRGFTHSHLGAVLFALAWDRLFGSGWIFFVAYLSHIWIDFAGSLLRLGPRRTT